MIYLDNGATTLIKPVSVGRAVSEAMRSMASPGRGGHPPAMLAAETVYACREAAAELFNVPEPEQVVFTMNATHALNIAINSLARAGERVVVSGFEHNSVTRPLTAKGAELVYAGTKLFDAADTLEDFDSKLKGAGLCVCTHVSNAFGYVLPIYEIAELCRRRSVPLIVDASQSAGVLDVDMQKLDAEFIAMPGHKSLFGPQGTGILLCKNMAKPYMFGGSGSDSVPQHMPDYLPDGLEAGTHNVCGIAGLLAGINYVRATGTGNILRHEQRLLKTMVSELDGSGAELFTGPGQSGVLSLRVKGMDCEQVAEGLSQRGICVRSGMHCAPTAHRSAGTLDTGTVRLSFSPFNDERQIKTACAAIREIAEKGK